MFYDYNRNIMNSVHLRLFIKIIYLMDIISKGQTQTICDGIIHCNEQKPYLEHVINDISTPHFKCTKNKLTFEHSCRSSQTSFLEQNEMFNKNYSKIICLGLFLSSNTYLLNLTYFNGLNLKCLNLTTRSSDENITPLASVFLNSIPNFERLYVSVGQIAPVSKYSALKIVKFDIGASSGTFGDCNNLETMTLVSWKVNVDHWLSSCNELTYLAMIKLENATVFRILRSAGKLYYIRYLHIIQCNIESLPDDIFSNFAQHLITLNLSKNRLKYFNLNTFRLNTLQVLNLSDNLFDSTNGLPLLLPNTSSKKSTLISLTLNGNKKLDVCNVMFDGSHSRVDLPKLRTLMIDGVNIKSRCYIPMNTSTFDLYFVGDFDRDFLKDYLEMVHMKRTYHPNHLQVHFISTNSKVRNIQFGEKEYQRYENLTNYFLSSVYIRLNIIIELDCDCHNAYFVKALNSYYIKAPNVYCSRIYNGTDIKIPLKDVPRRGLLCKKYECGNLSHPDTVCDCRRSWEDDTTTVDCRGKNVTEIPVVQNITEVYAPNNQIHTLSVQNLPDTLIYLDVRNNQIARLDKECTKHLFSNPNLHMKLSGNPIACDCDNLHFLYGLSNFGQVDDYDQIMCAGSDTALKNITDLNSLCSKFSKRALTAIIAVSVLVALAGIIEVLYYRYRKIIHMFLYIRGWCSCCIKEGDIDTDKFYDAFVSFCHEDEVIVLGQLVPQLEQRGFKICIHCRDWIPGEMIMPQLINAVETSRRTIIVLSKNFINSMWGMLEFRTAHMRAIKDGIARVIIIVIDDVIDEPDLDDELRNYISSNTYARWNDLWFWDKIVYALTYINLKLGY